MTRSSLRNIQGPKLEYLSLSEAEYKFYESRESEFPSITEALETGKFGSLEAKMTRDNGTTQDSHKDYTQMTPKFL